VQSLQHGLTKFLLFVFDDEKVGPKIMLCAGCRKARYCSEKCQLDAWKEHKPNCK
jgi:hypothetical protein